MQYFECPKCKGTHRVDYPQRVTTIRKFKIFKVTKYTRMGQTCPMCRGAGQLDWIENIRGYKISNRPLKGWENTQREVCILFKWDTVFTEPVYEIVNKVYQFIIK